MTLSPDLFRRDFESANSLIEGANGSVLETVAKATATTRSQMIAGYLVFGGPDLLIGSRGGAKSEFIIDRSYRARYVEDRETVQFADSAPYLATLAITDQIDIGRHGENVRRSCKAMNVNFNGHNIEDSARLMLNAYTSEDNNIDFSYYVLLVRSNYFRIMEKLVINEYSIGDYVVIPNFTIRSMCEPPGFDRWKARISTSSHAKRLTALREAITRPAI